MLKLFVLCLLLTVSLAADKKDPKKDDAKKNDKPTDKPKPDNSITTPKPVDPNDFKLPNMPCLEPVEKGAVDTVNGMAKTATGVIETFFGIIGI